MRLAPCVVVRLVTTDEAIDRGALANGLKTLNVPEIAVPRHVLHLEEIPVLGTGKADYMTLNRIAREKVPE